MISRRAVIAAAGLFSAGALAPGLARAAGRVPAPLPAFPLSIAVTEEEAGKPVRDDAWIDAQIAEAVRLFEPAGVASPPPGLLRAPAPRGILPTHREPSDTSGKGLDFGSIRGGRETHHALVRNHERPE
ncbi:hypothetical protein WMF39_45150 [Sorangium sp. So ce1504]|uniref:hypothetical protein n=1 Tax=Sorangium sp. So ce1504 TaxID=3133337 RepID=UPI003F5DE4BA